MHEKHETHHFNTEMRKIMDEFFDGSYSIFANHCGIKICQIWGYCQTSEARKFPTRRLLDKIISPLNLVCRRRILKAYLADVTPQSALGLIKLSDVNNRNVVYPDLPKNLPVEVQRAMRRLANLSIHSKECRKMIYAIESLMFGNDEK